MEHKTVSIAILFSGGLESTAMLLYYVNKGFSVELLYIKFGFSWETSELINIKNTIEKHIKLHVIDVSKEFNYKQAQLIDTQRKNIIPNRNLLMLSTASTYLYNINIFKIAIGLQGNSEYPDTSKKYITTLEKLIKIGLEEDSFEIQMPFYGYTKDEIFAQYKDSIDLDKVFSCTSPIENRPCKLCYKCMQLNKLKSDFKRLY
jgi:7-cyano-7-deazaguanine synthase